MKSERRKVWYASHKFYLRRRWGCWGVWVEWGLWGSASIIKLQCGATRRIATTRTNARPHPHYPQNTQFPHSVAVAFSKRNITFTGCTTQFLRRRLQIQRSAKMPPMGSTWRTSHWWHFLLAAVDVCLIVRNYKLSFSRIAAGIASL